MGWLDYHLHEFEVKEPGTGEIIEIGIPSEFFLTKLKQNRVGRKNRSFISIENRRALYRYDLGEDWEHKVLLQGIYQACFGGKRACPPEDCGGPFG